jgi:hypothetical protein
MAVSMVGPPKNRLPMSQRKSDLGIPLPYTRPPSTRPSRPTSLYAGFRRLLPLRVDAGPRGINQIDASNKFFLYQAEPEHLRKDKAVAYVRNRTVV